jgi:hypothetical protein
LNKGMDLKLKPLYDDHMRARITWREQDGGGGTLMVEVTVRNMSATPKSEDELKSDARAMAVRLARAFSDTIEAHGAV